MNGYCVEIENGPAKGFTYHTSVEPDRVIIVAKIDDRWQRVVESPEPWPEEARYRRDALLPPPADVDDDFLNEDGEIPVRYRVVEDA